MKRVIVLLLSFSLIFATCGCASLFMKKDALIELDDSTDTTNTGGITTSVKIDSYTQLFSGNLLSYDPSSSISILTQSEVTDSNSYQNKLLSYYNGNFYTLFTADSSFSEAKLDAATHDVYFKQKDAAADTSALYWATLQGDKKVRICDDVYDNYLAWDFTQNGYLVYVDKDNRIMLGDKNAQNAVFTLDKTYSVKEITYYSAARMLLLIASTGQTSNILYRIDLNSSPELNAIDVNVNDFAFSYLTGQTAYTKTTSGGDDQLYTYDYNNYLRTYLCSNYIEKLSYSPDGSYIAFATKATSQIPTQSIWIIRNDSNIPVQLTANTLLNSSIVWTADNSGLIFTTSNTFDSQNSNEPEYDTYYLKFSFDSADTSSAETGQNRSGEQ